MTRISHLPWSKPSNIPEHELGNNYTSYTIVMHPYMVRNYLKVYRLDERDVIEGMMFGSSFTYDRVSGIIQYPDPGMRGFKPVPLHRTFRDYSKSPNGIHSLGLEWYRNWSESDQSDGELEVDWGVSQDGRMQPISTLRTY